MTTPAQKRYQRMTAASLGSETQAMTRHASNLHEQMLMQLSEHRRALKTLQSLERKLQAKVKMLPEYESYIAGVLDSNSGRQDEVLVTIMLWYIDVGDIEKALPLAEYALSHKLIMPDRFERSLACTIAEEVAETAHRLHDADTPVPAALLLQTADLTHEFDMYDEARAKLYKQLGLAQESEGNITGAITSYEKALQLHERCGVKKFIERLQRELKKDPQPASKENDKPEATGTVPATKQPASRKGGEAS